MDILEENFPGALLAAHVQVHGHEMEGLKGLLLGFSDENRHLLDQDLSDSTAGHIQRFRRVILRDMKMIERLVFFNFKHPHFHHIRADTLVSVRLYLEKIDQRITELFSNLGYRDNPALRKFLKAFSKLLGLIISNSAMWESFETAILDVEAVRARDGAPIASNPLERSDKLQWHSYCRSKAVEVTEEMFSASERNGTEIPARLHRLPNGTLTILEHWRVDVNDVVGALLQVNESPIIREQIARVGETYYASVKNERTKKLRLAMSPVPRPYPLKHVPSWNTIAPSRLSDAAKFLEELDRSAFRMQGMTFFDVVLRTFYDVRGMRAVEKGRPSVIVRSGLRL